MTHREFRNETKVCRNLANEKVMPKHNKNVQCEIICEQIFNLQSCCEQGQCRKYIIDHFLN